MTELVNGNPYLPGNDLDVTRRKDGTFKMGNWKYGEWIVSDSMIMNIEDMA